MERPWSVMVRLDEIPDTGRHVALEANAAARADLAGPLGVDAVERVSATFDLARRGRDGLHIGGRVSATVRQICVVSLEPVVNEIDEEVDVDFAPPRAANDAAEDEEGRSREEPEPLIGNSVDLGVLATEYLILGVDPYPRRADVAFEAPAAGGAESPFAALAALKKKGTVKD